MSEIAQEVIDKAISMGWKPLDEFKGNVERWVDADEYVERGERVLPIVTATNRRLQQDLLTAKNKIDTLESKLDNASITLEKLEKHWSEANKRALENAKAQLREELRDARDSGDTAAEDTILGKLEEIRDTERSAAKAEKEKKDAPATNQSPPVDESTKEWIARNDDWFGKDMKKTKAFNRLAEDLRDEGVTAVGREFYDILDREYAERYGEREIEEAEEPERPVSKVEGVSPQPRGRKSKSFASLPAEAKQACHDDVDILVGPDKKYKTVKEWEDKYAAIYYGDA